MFKPEIISTGVIASVLFFELLLPYRKKSLNFSHLARNATLTTVNAVINILLFSFANAALFQLLNRYGLGLLNLWDMAFGVRLLISFLFLDFWMYCWHRINHEYKFFWNFHLVHHTDQAMDFSTAFRFHPFEIILSSLLNIIIYLALGLNVVELMFYRSISQAVILFHHSDIRMNDNSDALLRLFFVTPHMHRVHHSRKRSETDSNYSVVFSFWDRIFGTFKIVDLDNVIYGLEYFRTVRNKKLTALFLQPYRYLKGDVL